jgi:hypothetical protein
MIIRILAIAVVWLCCSVGHAEEAVEIPLSEIWALDMPGTKNVKELEPEHEKLKGMQSSEVIERSLIYNTAWLLNANNRPPSGGIAEQGFVVPATGFDALKEANAILSKKASREHILPAGQSLTLVFFSYSCPRSIQIDEVIRSENRVVVKYHFHAHNLRKSQSNFALIPLGTFSADGIERQNVKVTFERLPDTSRDSATAPLDDRRALETVCDSFVFGVMNQKP